MTSTLLDRVLERLEGVTKTNSGWKALCPVHDDQNPSLSIAQGTDGRVLLKCFAGCENPEIVTALGLDMHDLFERRNGSGEERGVNTPSNNATTPQRSILKDYAQAKGLPVEFLEQLGLSNVHYMGKPAIRIPYRTPDGLETAIRFRTALEKTNDGPDRRFRWRKGSKPTLYGLEHLENIKKAGRVILVEGESDAQTCWYHGVPTLGIPGASSWKSEWSEHLEGIEKIFAVIEPDEGGESLWERLAASPIRERLYRVNLDGVKDVSELHVDDPEHFGLRFEHALEKAVSYMDLAESEAQELSREAWAKCESLAQEPNILECFARELLRCGVVGETRVAKLLYLAVASRVLERPVSIALKGPSGGGKSFLVEQVLRFFPESSFYALTAMSEHALAYSDEPLSHRFLVIYEAAGMHSDFQSYLIRSLLSEGRVRYETVEKTSEGMKARLIEREGPTGLIVTTTAVRLHPENETRMLSLTVTDTHAQTQAVMASLADETSTKGPDLEQWQALQTYLETAESRCTIPYAHQLATLVPPVAVRLRRDFAAVLNLIRAHALLQQASRERDAEGHVVASIGDYAAVRELVADLVSEGVEATVAPTIRETVAAVHRLHEEHGEPVSLRVIAEALRIDKSSASRRVRTAIDKGFLENLEDRKGKPGQYQPADPLPDDIEVLPQPDEVNRCTVAPVLEGIHTPPPSSSDGGSACGKARGMSYPSDNGATPQRYDDEVE